MRSDHVTLSWLWNGSDKIGAGAYIIYEDEKFSLLDDYIPQQKKENEWLYQPKFHSSVMEWQKVPFFMYSKDSSGVIVGKEIDWSLTATAQVFLERIVETIKEETGVEYTFITDAVGSISETFSSTDIFSSLNDIAQKFNTEWWIDKKNAVIHLSYCSHGDPVSLEVGTNIGVPSVNINSEGFFNRFYVFGSSRNIVQTYTGANVNNIANKRLTLNPDKYPDGYYEPYGPQEKVFSKILVFDDVYPAATNLYITDLIARLVYNLDDEGNKIQIGTDTDGNAIYDVYTAWYFKPSYLSPDGTYSDFVFNDWNYTEDDNVVNGRAGMLIAGLNVSIKFESGLLQGRDFEVVYYKKDTTIADASGLSIVVPAGYFGIQYVKEGDYIIPDHASLFPNVGDNIMFFNIKMPELYTTDAYDRLEEAMLKTIDEKFLSDLNQYTFSAYPIEFHNNNIALEVGSNVLYKNQDYEYGTRVVSITRRLDYSELQSITIGNTLIKGTIQQLKDDANSANRNLEIIANINSATNTLANAYARAHQTMLEMMNSLSELFVIDEDGNLKTTRGLYSTSFISARGSDPNTGGGGGGGGVSYLNDLLDVTLRASSLNTGDMLVWNATNQKYEVINKSELGGGGTIILDTEMSDTSENGVQNKVIKNYVDLHPQYETVTEIDAPKGDFASVITVSTYSELPSVGVAKKIYITEDDNKTYRWDGTSYVPLGVYMEIGETEGTAYDGAKGKANADAIASVGARVDSVEADVQVIQENYVNSGQLESITERVNNVELAVGGLTDYLPDDMQEGDILATQTWAANNFGGKLDQSVWDEFVSHLEVDSDGNIHVKSGLYADTFISARGSDPNTNTSLEARVAALETKMNELLNA